MRTDDPYFDMGTMYYLSLQNDSVDLIPTTASITLSQIRTVYKIPNSVPQKFQFTSERELIKSMMFSIPRSWSTKALTTLSLEALTDDFYPSIYLNKIQLDDEPEDVETMNYPTIVDFDYKFGTNPLDLLGESKFVYTLDTQNEGNFNYFTIAIY